MIPVAWVNALKILEATNCPLPLASLYCELREAAPDPEGWAVYLDPSDNLGFAAAMWRVRLTGESDDYGDKCVVEYSDGCGDFEHVCIGRVWISDGGRYGGWRVELCEESCWEYADQIAGNWTEEVNAGLNAALLAWKKEQELRADAAKETA